MTSLIFRALDQHVVAGHADHLAIDDGTVSMTYAELLAQIAALAGGLAHVGVSEGKHVSIDIGGVAQIGAVLACARLGAVPDAKGTFRIDGDPPIVHAGTHDYLWATILSAGKTDPAPAPDRDKPGYEKLLLEKYGEIFATLKAGKTISRPQDLADI